MHMLSLVCIAREVFLFGECMSSAQGQSALSRQRSGVQRKPLHALTSALLKLVIQEETEGVRRGVER
ncbi:unnamed protein product [Staurois parvus]|uniref:Secreted protein n=1 Tax=Staurois parvus TaxID=386267 RepID=A0ABN9CZS0_9NEOB|nr:unnamed protein product [Staurois parvus]